MSVTLPDPDAPLCPTIRGEANMPDMVMDAGDGTQRVIESDAIRALVGYVEQRDGHHRGLDAADDEQDDEWETEPGMPDPNEVRAALAADR